MLVINSHIISRITGAAESVEEDVVILKLGNNCKDFPKFMSCDNLARVCLVFGIVGIIQYSTSKINEKDILLFYKNQINQSINLVDFGERS